MTSNTTVVSLRQPDEVDDPLTAILRSGARRLLAQAVEAEAEAFLAAMRELRLPDGRERLVRHGLGPERLMQRFVGASVMTASSACSRRRRYSRRVLSARPRCRRASTTAHSSRAFMRGAKMVPSTPSWSPQTPADGRSLIERALLILTDQIAGMGARGLASAGGRQVNEGSLNKVRSAAVILQEVQTNLLTISTNCECWRHARDDTDASST
jgi:hypothetical protein